MGVSSRSYDRVAATKTATWGGVVAVVHLATGLHNSQVADG